MAKMDKVNGCGSTSFKGCQNIDEWMIGTWQMDVRPNDFGSGAESTTWKWRSAALRVFDEMFLLIWSLYKQPNTK